MRSVNVYALNIKFPHNNAIYVDFILFTIIIKLVSEKPSYTQPFDSQKEYIFDTLMPDDCWPAFEAVAMSIANRHESHGHIEPLSPLAVALLAEVQTIKDQNLKHFANLFLQDLMRNDNI